MKGAKGVKGGKRGAKGTRGVKGQGGKGVGCKMGLKGVKRGQKGSERRVKGGGGERTSHLVKLSLPDIFHCYGHQKFYFETRTVVLFRSKMITYSSMLINLYLHIITIT